MQDIEPMTYAMIANPGACPAVFLCKRTDFEIDSGPCLLVLVLALALFISAGSLYEAYCRNVGHRLVP